MTIYLNVSPDAHDTLINEIAKTMSPLLRHYTDTYERFVNQHSYAAESERLAEAIVELFKPQHVGTLTVSIQFNDELGVHKVSEYVIRLVRARMQDVSTLSIRSAMGVELTMERTQADVPVFWGDDGFVGLWLPDWQTDRMRIAYITTAYSSSSA